MRITSDMVDLMKTFSIMARCQDTITGLREIYRFGLDEWSQLCDDEKLTTEQASAVLDFIIDVIRKEEARIENNNRERYSYSPFNRAKP